MKSALQSTSYWATAISMLVLKWSSPRLEEAHLLLACVAATYFIGRGFTQIPKLPVAGVKSREFLVLMQGIVSLAIGLSLRDPHACVALAVLVGGYNIGRGLANYYRSKVQMVVNH